MAVYSTVDKACIAVCLAMALLATANGYSRKEDCFVGGSRDYLGTQSLTVSGRTCQAWSAQSPHNHQYGTTPGHFKHDDGMPSNYCRNTVYGQGHESGTWCYTTDPDKRWELCGISECTAGQDPIIASDCFVGNSRNYIGTQSVTWSGRTCQAWSAQAPHWHKYGTTPAHFPHDDEMPSNYCRNTVYGQGAESGTWCYTTDRNKRWELCGISECTAGQDPIIALSADCFVGGSRNYQGTQSLTVSGRTCQAWSAQSPHNHRYGKHPAHFKLDGEMPYNYCRNTVYGQGHESGTWCYTTDPNKRWELCGISECTA